MKRMISAKSILVCALLALVGCSSISGTPYSVTHREFKDLENPFTVDSVNIYSDILYQIGVTKWTDTKGIWYTLDVEYNGQDWEFLDGNVKILTKDGLSKINDKKPRRDVRSGGVTETVHAQMDLGLLKSMATSDSIQVQFFAEPVTISSEGLTALHDFYSKFVE